MTSGVSPGRARARSQVGPLLALLALLTSAASACATGDSSAIDEGLPTGSSSSGGGGRDASIAVDASGSSSGTGLNSGSDDATTVTPGGDDATVGDDGSDNIITDDASGDDGASPASPPDA